MPQPLSYRSPFLPLQASQSTESALERARISAALDRAEVQQQLRAYGVTPDEIRMRVAALSDAEAAELAARIESLPAGGIGLVGAIVLVFLVLLLTDIPVTRRSFRSRDR